MASKATSTSTNGSAREDRFGPVVAKFFACFPGTQEWLGRLANGDDVLTQWRHELDEYSTLELLDAIEAIRTGRSSKPEAYERELWPAFIQDAADKARAQAAAELEAQAPRGSDYRVSCRLCRDIGSVEVWSVETMEDARRALRFSQTIEEDQVRWQTAHMQCSCDRGKPTWPRRRGGTIVHVPVPRYDPNLCILASEGREALLEWARNFRPRRPSSDSQRAEPSQQSLALKSP